jgi:hypothetical protein
MANDSFYFPSAFLVANGMADLIPPEERSPVIVLTTGEVKDLAYRVGGRAALPPKPIMIVGPNGSQPLFLAANGNVEGAELEEIAIAEFEKQESLRRQGKGPIDFDGIRERRGLPPRAQFDTMFREALQARIKKHKRNPVTDKPRQMLFPLRKWQSHPGLNKEYSK